MSKKKKKLRYLKQMQEQKLSRELLEQEDDTSDQEPIQTEKEEVPVQEEETLSSVSDHKEYNEDKIEKGLLIFLLGFFLFIVIVPGDILNRISIFINKILP